MERLEVGESGIQPSMSTHILLEFTSLVLYLDLNPNSPNLILSLYLTLLNQLLTSKS